MTGEKIKIKNKNCNINSGAAHSGDNNISGGESENQGSNGGAALNNPGLKRRHSSTLFAPKHAGMRSIGIYFSRQCRKIRAKFLVFSYTSGKKKLHYILKF